MLLNNSESRARIEGHRICFVIPGEPTPGFLSQIAMFNVALTQAAAPLCDSRVVAYLGDDGSSVIDERWQRQLRGVELRIVPEKTAEINYIAQAALRFTFDEPDIDIVILCDADTLLLGNLDDVLSLLNRGFPVAGVIAHFHPSNFTNPNKDWQSLSEQLIHKKIPLTHVYTLMDRALVASEEAPRAPFYLNHGFIAFRADALREFSKPYLDIRAQVAAILDPPFFAGQIALALTVQLLGWEGVALPMRYNFPNDELALNLHAYESHDIRLLHYLRERNFVRTNIFANEASFNLFMQERPSDCDNIFFDAIERLTGGIYPFH